MHKEMKSTFQIAAMLVPIILAAGCAVPQAAQTKASRPPLIDVEVSIVRITTPTTAAGEQAGPAAVAGWVREGKGAIVHAFSLVAESGVEAHAEDVTLVSYPALFSVPRPDGSTADRAPPETAFRQIGVDISALSTLEPGDKHVSVCLAANLVGIEDWRTNRVTLVSSSNTVELVARQPIFHKLSLDTCVRVPFGATVIAGGPLQESKSGGAIYMLISAQPTKLP